MIAVADGSIECKIEEVLSSYQPYIQGHGGSISLVKYEQGIVYVRLEGACAHCPASLFTLKLGIEEGLKKEIPSIQEVIALED